MTFFRKLRKRRRTEEEEEENVDDFGEGVIEEGAIGENDLLFSKMTFCRKLRKRRRTVEEEEEEEGLSLDDFGEGEVIEEGAIGENDLLWDEEGAIGENDLLWYEEVGESSSEAVIEGGMGVSSESIEGLEALFWDEGVGGSNDESIGGGGVDDLTERLEALIDDGVGRSDDESIDDGLEALLFWDPVVGDGGESIEEDVEGLIEGLEEVSWESCQEEGVSPEWVTSCVICLEEFGDCSEVVEELRRLPCLHVFHKDCIARWIQRSHLCPLCRFPVTRSIYRAI